MLLALGVVGPIANWNSTLLSEPVAISLSMLLVAAWIRYAQRPTWATAALVLLATVPWTFSRQADVLVGAMICAAAVVAWLLRPRLAIRAALAAGLLVIAGIGFWEVGNNHTIQDSNVETFIQESVLVKPSWTKWFVDHGMPYDSTIAETAGKLPYDDPVEADPAFAAWVKAHGLHTYVRFMLSHPRYTLFGPLQSFPGELASLHRQNTSPYAAFAQPNPTPSMLSPDTNYGRHRGVLPSVVQNLLFQQGQIGDVLALAAITCWLTIRAWRRFGPDRRLWVPALLAVSAIPQAYAVWLSGGGADGELDRLSMILAVSLRVGLWIVLALAVDRLLAARATASTVR